MRSWLPPSLWRRVTFALDVGKTCLQVPRIIRAQRLGAQEECRPKKTRRQRPSSLSTEWRTRPAPELSRRLSSGFRGYATLWLIIWIIGLKSSTTRVLSTWVIQITSIFLFLFGFNLFQEIYIYIPSCKIKLFVHLIYHIVFKI